MVNNFVGDLLQKAAEDEIKAQQSVTVDKQIPLTFDLRHMLAVDTNPLDGKELRSGNRESYLRSLARDNCQLICNELWRLETHRVDDVVVAQLPQHHQYLLPRSKPVPKPKAPTKWETYAKMKGIHKTKKDKLVWDETASQWKPRFGYRGVNQDKDWAIEVPNNADPNVNYFEKKSDEKKERIAKNEFQRLRNISRSQRLKVGGSGGVMPHTNQNPEQLKKAAVLAKQATASVGRFTEKLADEKAPKNSGKKRQFEPNFGDMNVEKDKSMKIIDNIINKKPKLDINKIVEPMVKNRMSKRSKGNDFKDKKGQKFDKRRPKGDRNGDRRDTKSNSNDNKFNNKQNKANKPPPKKSNKFGAGGKHRKK